MSTTQDDRLAGIASGLAFKAPVRVATTAALLGLSALQTIDTVVLAAGDRVLVKDQIDQTTNGIYVAATGLWTRDFDFDGSRDAAKGTLMLITEGSVNIGKVFELTTANPVLIGSSNLTFSQYQVGGTPTTPFSLLNGGTGVAGTSVIGLLAYLGLIQCTGEAGSANAQSCTIDAMVTALRADQIYIFNPTIANTNAATITITPSGGGALGSPAVHLNGAALVGGELQIGSPVLLQYDGTFLNIIGPLSTPAIGISAILKTFVNAKGDLIGASADNTPAIITAGADGTVLQADSTQTTGLVWRAKAVSMGVVAATSGASIDFTGIPAWATRITIMFLGVSTTGTSAVRVQLGDSGGIETTGYLGASSGAVAAAIAAANFTSGFDLNDSLNAAGIRHGALTLTLMDPATNTWVMSGSLGQSDGIRLISIAGSKATSAVLDRVRVTTVGGSDTFDAGSINVRYE